MKLVRYGKQGAEKPGLIDADGKVRDLSAVVSDIAGEVLGKESLSRLKAIDPASLPLAPVGERIGALDSRARSESVAEFRQHVVKVVIVHVFEPLHERPAPVETPAAPSEPAPKEPVPERT